MYHPHATPTQKCLAYAIADHLNCVTLDSWPAQTTLARLLGQVSTKTVQRAAGGLETFGLIRLIRSPRKKSQHRYAPVFIDKDTDILVPLKRQICPRVPDTNVHQSSSEIYLESSSTVVVPNRDTPKGRTRLSFGREKRGALELKVADLLGADGMELLSKLAAIDDEIIDRLCQAYADGVLSERDLAAVRLAAEQAR
jgi:hypothetical protein